MLKISFSPTITSTIPKANLRYFIFSIALAKTKYKDRNPKIAKILEVYIIILDTSFVFLFVTRISTLKKGKFSKQ